MLGLDMGRDRLSGTLTQRSSWWGMLFAEMLGESAELRALMPVEAIRLAVMPAENPEVAMYQLELNASKPPESLVFVRIERVQDHYDAIPYLPHRPQAQALR